MIAGGGCGACPQIPNLPVSNTEQEDGQRNSQNQPLADDDDGGGETNSFIQGYRLPASGSYRITAAAYQGNSTGDFILTLGKQTPCGTDVSELSVV